MRKKAWSFQKQSSAKVSLPQGVFQACPGLDPEGRLVPGRVHHACRSCSSSFPAISSMISVTFFKFSQLKPFLGLKVLPPHKEQHKHKAAQQTASGRQAKQHLRLFRSARPRQQRKREGSVESAKERERERERAHAFSHLQLQAGFRA